MITKERLIDGNAVTVVEVSSKLIKRGKDYNNFFTKPYIEKLYSYSKYCKQEQQDRWMKKIDYTFLSIGKRTNEEVITLLDSIECAGDIMKAIDTDIDEEKISEMLKQFGLSGERLIYITGLMLEYSKYGIELHDKFLKPHEDLSRDYIDTLYLMEQANRTKEVHKQKKFGDNKKFI